MSNYSQSIDFSAKDALASGNPSKKILGADIDTELNLISTAIATKQDSTGSAAGLTALPAAEGGSLVLFNRTVASGASAVSWTLTTGYDRYYVVANNVTVSTTANLLAQFSTDGGSTWIGSTSNAHVRFAGSTVGIGTDVSVAGSSGDSSISFGTGFTSAYYIALDLSIDISTPSTVKGTSSWFASGVNQGIAIVFGGVASAANAFRILPSTGTISGNFSLYGVKRT